jgi:hypothetical protein
MVKSVGGVLLKATIEGCATTKYTYLPKLRPMIVSTFCLLASVLCAACNGRTSNIKPGEADYPAINSSPAHTVKVDEDPPSNQVQFIVGYRATKPGGPTDSQQTCEFEVGGGVLDYFFVTELVNWQSNGQLALDRYQPGRCGWAFSRVGFTVNGPTDPPQELFSYNDDPDRPSNLDIDIWCFVAPNRPRACADIKGLQPAFPTLIPPKVMRQIVDSGQGDGPPATIGPRTSSVRIRFHNLNGYLADHRSDY